MIPVIENQQSISEAEAPTTAQIEATLDGVLRESESFSGILRRMWSSVTFSRDRTPRNADVDANAIAERAEKRAKFLAEVRDMTLTDAEAKLIQKQHFWPALWRRAYDRGVDVDVLDFVLERERQNARGR